MYSFMKKYVLSLCIGTLLCLNIVSAQSVFNNPSYTKKELSLSINNSLITGSKSQYYSYAYGIDGMLSYQIEQTTYIGLGVGLQILNIKPEEMKRIVESVTTLPIEATAFVSVLPLYVGIRHDLTAEGFQPYIGLDIGTSVMSIFVFVTDTDSKQSDGSDDIGFDTQISIMPKIGFRVPFTKNLLIDAHLKYNHFATSIFDYTLFSQYYMGLVSGNIGLTYVID